MMNVIVLQRASFTGYVVQSTTHYNLDLDHYQKYQIICNA